MENHVNAEDKELAKLAYNFLKTHSMRDQHAMEESNLSKSPLVSIQNSISPSRMNHSNPPNFGTGFQQPIGNGVVQRFMTTIDQARPATKVMAKDECLLGSPEGAKLWLTVELMDRAQRILPLPTFRELIFAFRERETRFIPVPDTIAKISRILQGFPQLREDFQKALISV